jgi:hypothetical protein
MTDPVPRADCGTIGTVLIRLKSHRRSLLSRTTIVPASAAVVAMPAVATGTVAAVNAVTHTAKRLRVCIGSPAFCRVIWITAE